jgi:coenzyme F420-reducing hydrogenase beta subunit
MDYNELLEKYYAIQRENHLLREEIKRLKLRVGIPEQQGIPFEFSEQKPMPEMIEVDCDEVKIMDINHWSIPTEKSNYSGPDLEAG